MTFERRLRLTGRNNHPVDVLATGPYPSGFAGETVLTQLHCHTTGSDGSSTPAQAVAAYLARGYDALAITDHNVVTTQPAGLTTDIPANELGVGTNMVHIIGLNPGAYELDGETDPQTIIDGIRLEGGEAHIAHPNWIGSSLSASTIAALTDFYGIEIHNGKVMGGATAGVNPVTNPGFAIAKWTDVLATKRDTWAVAVDDLHQQDAFNTYDMGRVHVFADSTDAEDIVSALVAGNYVADVANYGVTPGYPDRTDTDITVECTGATRIEAWGRTGLLGADDSDTLTYTYAGTETYVRLEAVGDYTEGFDSTLPHPWTAYNGSWAVSGGTLRLTGDSSPAHVILPRHRAGDFTASIDMRRSSDSDAAVGLMFNVLNENYWYILRAGPSSLPAFNNKLAVYYTTDGGSTPNLVGSADLTMAADTMYTFEIAYTASTGRIQAKAWATGGAEPGDMIDVTHSSWTWGGFGIRANRTPQFDNLYLDGFRTYYQPVSIDPA